jgi:hypothetical protein
MFFVKRILPFILVLAIGYTLGYNDAYRGPSSLGWKIGDITDRLQPDAVREQRARNAEAIRQKQRDGLPVVPD